MRARRDVRARGLRVTGPGRLRAALIVTAVVLLGAGGMALAAAGGPFAPAAAGGQPESARRAASLVASPAEGTVGTTLTLSGQGFPPGAPVELLWNTASAHVAAEGNLYAGRVMTARREILGRVTAGADGTFEYAVAVPPDYGGMHDVVALVDGQEVAHTGVRVWPSLSIDPPEGPVGTPIRLRGEGFGLSPTDSQFHVIYDNHYLGLFSAVNTRGQVEIVLPAAGAPGLHRIDVYPNYYGPAYLNNHDGFPEYARVPRWSWNFRVTSPESPLAPPPARFVSSRVPGEVPELPPGASLSVTPRQGPVGSRIRLAADGFRPGEAVEVVWRSISGAYIMAGGFQTEDRVLARSQAGPDGRVELAITVPPDVGGWHPVMIRGASGVAVGVFGVVREVTVSPVAGPPGTTIHVRLTGVGWRSWENNTAVTWDNGYTGYACALGPERGTINVYLTAVGHPGRHVIGLWPAIFRGPLTINYGGREPDNQRLPVLAPEDLPEFIEPLTFFFDVTEPEAPGDDQG